MFHAADINRYRCQQAIKHGFTNSHHKFMNTRQTRILRTRHMTQSSTKYVHLMDWFYINYTQWTIYTHTHTPS